MAKQSMAERLKAQTAAKAETDNLPRGQVITGRVAVPADLVPVGSTPVAPDGFKVRQRIEKPHVSVYLHPRVIRQIREIAAAENGKAHDIYVEGIRMALKARGYDLDAIERGE